MRFKLAVAIGMPVGGTHTGLGHPLALLVALDRALALHGPLRQGQGRLPVPGLRARRSRRVFLGLFGGEGLKWDGIAGGTAGAGKGVPWSADPPVPAMGMPVIGSITVPLWLRTSPSPSEARWRLRPGVAGVSKTPWTSGRTAPLPSCPSDTVGAGSG